MLRRRVVLVLLAVLTLLGTIPGAAQAAVPPPNSEPYIAPVDQPISLDQCYLDHKHGYYVKNVFNACWFTDMKFAHYACPEPACAVDGTAAAYEYTTTRALKDARQVAVTHRFVNWRTDNVPDTARFGVTIDCGPVAGGGGVCDQPGVTIVRSIAEWKADKEVTRVFTLTGEDAPAAGASPEVQAEKRTEYTVRSHLVAETAPGDRFTLTPDTTGSAVRCDVARELNPEYARGSDCMLRTWYTPYFDFAANEQPTLESAKFVKDYASHGYLPGYPGYQGTSSGFTGPQNRLFYDAAAQQSHRAVADAKCAEVWGPNYAQRPDGQLNVCAAYPFDDTRQGATSEPSTSGRPRFEVRPVLAADWQEFQRRFARYLAENHILDGDQIYIYPL